MRDERDEVVIRDTHFKEVAEVKLDSKNRVTLGKQSSTKATIYKVYRNTIGQIVLDPQVTIPAYEQWLFRNPEASKLVQAGLEDARKGRLVKAREDYSKYTEKD
jgi:hypothetical protein